MRLRKWRKINYTILSLSCIHRIKVLVCVSVCAMPIVVVSRYQSVVTMCVFQWQLETKICNFVRDRKKNNEELIRFTCPACPLFAFFSMFGQVNGYGCVLFLFVDRITILNLANWILFTKWKTAQNTVTHFCFTFFFISLLLFFFVVVFNHWNNSVCMYVV